MTAKFFVDTNILLYAGSHAADDQPKRQAARAVLAAPDIAFSAQVLQEFYTTLSQAARRYSVSGEFGAMG
jgi:predicted nucleic acid-binding protein